MPPGFDPNAVMADQFVRLLVMYTLQAVIQAVTFGIAGIVAVRVLLRMEK